MNRKKNKMKIRRLLFLLYTGFFATTSGASPELPQYADETHLGVASCASSTCHGSIKPRNSTKVLQNEYVVWSRLDAHQGAYQTLLSEESIWIAKNLGLPNAHEADVCLDCHADNVASDKRDNRFQISDGVGCEACHGGAESYLMSHTDPRQSHKDNIADGLYPTDQVETRASLCFSCHVGHEDKIASHEIMGAGHPRLGFELDTFTILQPAHFVVDEDYQRAKWHADSVTVWALGQIEAGRQSLRLIESHLDTGNLFPELSLFDCHSCHHPMSDLKWQSKNRVGLPPGAVRLNDAGLVMLIPLSKVITGSSSEFENAVRELQISTYRNKDKSQSIKKLRALMDQLNSRVLEGRPDDKQLLSNILAMAKDGDFSDYVAAEQAVMAIDLLFSFADQRQQNAKWLDRMYEAVADEDSFDPFEFQDVF